MEMLNAGMINIIVVDNYKAKLWAKLLPKIVLHENIAIKTADEFAWMIRKDSPLLLKVINDFAQKHKQGTLFGNILLNRYIDKTQLIEKSTSKKELTKFVKLVELFRQYSNKYDLNYLLMLAQGYQESKLNQKAKSRVGAIGIMQLMPSTGKEMKVGDIKKIEANIHAGIKYHQYILNRYFKDEEMTDLDRALFTLAAYNAGPARVIKLRKEAGKRGFNPNIWFDNVELIAAERIGSETVTYISNIFKYYIGYKLFEEKKEESRKAKETLHLPSK
jgi:membrane-bound lytic murein transglycosylase MltF